MLLLRCSSAAASVCPSWLGEHSHSHSWRTRDLEPGHKPAIFPGEPVLGRLIHYLWLLCISTPPTPNSDCKYSNTLIRPRAAWFTPTVTPTLLHHHPRPRAEVNLGPNLEGRDDQKPEGSEPVQLKEQPAPSESQRKRDRKEGRRANQKSKWTREGTRNSTQSYRALRQQQQQQQRAFKWSVKPAPTGGMSPKVCRHVVLSPPQITQEMSCSNVNRQLQLEYPEHPLHRRGHDL